MTSADETAHQSALKILLCGGIAGIVTWASIFPLDVIKTRLQAQPLVPRTEGQLTEARSLLGSSLPQERRLSSIEIAREAYRTEGLRVFYRGLGICSIRAFIVNAVQVC
jgi:solute carrier family 25 carnitine/acylcarnitine transporter 20/29